MFKPGGPPEHLPNSKDSRTTPEVQADKRAGKKWTAPSGTLGQLTKEALERSRSLAPDSAASRARATDAPGGISLRESLIAESVAVIAEIKRSSPSKGSINLSIDAGRQAEAYTAGGASGISVLTEPRWFGGDDADVAASRRMTTLPILKKDFHVSPVQLIHARQLGCSAALIIVRAIEPALLREMADLARFIQIEIVFEVRSEDELTAAMNAGANMVGVNNRDLETLVIDPTTVERIVPLIPRGCIAIAESGYSTRREIEVAAGAGADAVLVGSSISASPDPVAAVRGLVGVPVTARRG